MKLENLRKQIDATDEALVSLLAKRMNIVKKIRAVKLQQGLPSLDQNRWQEVLSSVVLKAKTHGLNTDLVREIWNSINYERIKTS